MQCSSYLAQSYSQVSMSPALGSSSGKHNEPELALLGGTQTNETCRDHIPEGWRGAATILIQLGIGFFAVGVRLTSTHSSLESWNYSWVQLLRGVRMTWLQALRCRATPPVHAQRQG